MSGQDEMWNIVSIIFLILTLVAIIMIAVIFITQEGDSGEVLIPEVAQLPTATLTFTPSITPTDEPPTFTWTPSWTPSPTRTPTRIPSLTPSITASPSPTITNTPPASNTPTDTLTPTATTGATETAPPPLPFALQIEPQFTANVTNQAGCDWQGIGGQVLDLQGNPYTGELYVNVFTQLEEFERVQIGTNSFYGQSGFEVRVADAITAGTYFVELESRVGTLVAPRAQVTFPGSCDANLAQLTFQQVRPIR